MAETDRCVNCEEAIGVYHRISMLERCYEGYMHHEEAADTFAVAQSALARRVIEIVDNFASWVYCDCHACRVFAGSHAVKTRNSIQNLIAALRAELEKEGIKL